MKTEKLEQYTTILCELIFAAMKSDKEIPDAYSLESVLTDENLDSFVLALYMYAPGIIINKLIDSDVAGDDHLHRVQVLFNQHRIEELLIIQREELKLKYNPKEK